MDFKKFPSPSSVHLEQSDPNQPLSPGSTSGALGFPGEQLLVVKHPALVSEIPDSLAFGTGWHENVSVLARQVLAAASEPWHSRSWQLHPAGRRGLHKWGFAVIPSHFEPEMLSLLPPPRDTQDCCSWIKELQLRGFSQKQIQLLTSVKS